MQVQFQGELVTVESSDIRGKIDRLPFIEHRILPVHPDLYGQCILRRGIEPEDIQARLPFVRARLACEHARDACISRPFPRDKVPSGRDAGERAFQGGQRSGVAGYVDLYVQALDECGRGDPHPFGTLVFQTFVQHGRTAESLHAGNVCLAIQRVGGSSEPCLVVVPGAGRLIIPGMEQEAVSALRDAPPEGVLREGHSGPREGPYPPDRCNS